MGVGTKHRQQQAADLCKQHLREKQKDKLGLVNEYWKEEERIRTSHGGANFQTKSESRLIG